MYTVAVTDAGYTTPSQMVPVDAGGTASSDFVLTSEHSRNPLLQPFTTTSIWNRPIGSDAQYDAGESHPRIAVHAQE